MQTLLGKHWHHMPSQEIIALLDADPKTGLDVFELKRRLFHFGPNTLTPRRGKSPLDRFILQFHNPLTYILLVAGVATTVVKNLTDAITIFAVVLFNAIVGYIQEAKAEKAIEALAQTLVTEALVLRSGQMRTVPAAELVPGDIVILHNKLQPILNEAKQNKRIVLFVDAAHFVMGAFLVMLWCFTRVLLPSSSGRKRYNVLGAYNPITNEVITLNNDTYINGIVFCEFLNKIANIYANTGLSITLILDNAKYQKCSLVAAKAKELGISLLYLPSYSPNLNLIERLWRFIKKQVLYSTHYDDFKTFKNSIDTCISELGTRFKSQIQSLMTMNFQLFSVKTEKLPT